MKPSTRKTLAYSFLSLVGAGWLALVAIVLLSLPGCTSWAPDALRADALHAAAVALRDPQGPIERQALVLACEIAARQASRAILKAQRALTAEAPDYAAARDAAKLAISVQEAACKAAGIEPQKAAPVTPATPAAASPDGGMQPADAAQPVAAPPTADLAPPPEAGVPLPTPAPSVTPAPVPVPSVVPAPAPVPSVAPAPAPAPMPAPPAGPPAPPAPGGGA